MAILSPRRGKQRYLGVGAASRRILGAMRWFVGLVFLAGCVRARTTVVHLTDVERTSGGRGSVIARVDPTQQQPEAPQQSANLASVELGALVPFKNINDSTRVHIAPGVRIFNNHADKPLFGVAVGADFEPHAGGTGFALEGSIHAGDSSPDVTVIEQALDLFTGVTFHARSMESTIAVGPSLGILGLPGGQSVITVGLGVRFTGAQR